MLDFKTAIHDVQTTKDRLVQGLKLSHIQGILVSHCQLLSLDAREGETDRGFDPLPYSQVVGE